MAPLVEVMYFKEMSLLKLRHNVTCYYGAGFVTERVRQEQ